MWRRACWGSGTGNFASQRRRLDSPEGAQNAVAARTHVEDVLAAGQAEGQEAAAQEATNHSQRTAENPGEVSQRAYGLSDDVLSAVGTDHRNRERTPLAVHGDHT